jgi:hypothetical protein
MEFFHPLAFFIALIVGLFFAYISTPNPKVIIKYPTPENAGKVVYKDNSGVCYKYHAKEIDCPTHMYVDSLNIQDSEDK